MRRQRRQRRSRQRQRRQRRRRAAGRRSIGPNRRTRNRGRARRRRQRRRRSSSGDPAARCSYCPGPPAQNGLLRGAGRSRTQAATTSSGEHSVALASSRASQRRAAAPVRTGSCWGTCCSGSIPVLALFLHSRRRRHVDVVGVRPSVPHSSCEGRWQRPSADWGAGMWVTAVSRADVPQFRQSAGIIISLYRILEPRMGLVPSGTV